MEPRSVYEIAWSSLWKVLAFVVVAWFLYLSLDILLAILLALIIAAGLDTPVGWLERKGVPRLLSTLFLFIVGIVFVAAIIYTVVPIAITDLNQLFSNLKDFAGPLFNIFEQANGTLGNVNSRLNDITNGLLSGTLPFTQVVSSLFGGILLTITVLILSFYLTIGQDGVEKFLAAILPASYEDTAINLYLRTRKKIGKWLKGQLLLSLLVGTSVFIGLWILGVKYSLLLGILAGLFEIVPFVGPIFSGGIAVLVALSGSFSLALYTLILFVIIQQLENNLFVPAVMRFTTSLNPVVVLIAILVGGKVFGFIGLIIAVPVAVFVQEIIEDWTTAKKKKRGLL